MCSTDFIDWRYIHSWLLFSTQLGNCCPHGRRNYKDTNPKCRLYWCLIEFIDWRYSQSCWYFRLLLWTVAPLPSLWPTPPLPILPKVNIQYCEYKQWVAVEGGMVSSCVVDHILQEFNTLFLTRFRTYKIASPPQTKTPVKTTFRDWCLYSPCGVPSTILKLFKAYITI